MDKQFVLVENDKLESKLESNDLQSKIDSTDQPDEPQNEPISKSNNESENESKNESQNQPNLQTIINKVEDENNNDLHSKLDSTNEPNKISHSKADSTKEHDEKPEIDVFVIFDDSAEDSSQDNLDSTDKADNSQPEQDLAPTDSQIKATDETNLQSKSDNLEVKSDTKELNDSQVVNDLDDEANDILSVFEIHRTKDKNLKKIDNPNFKENNKHGELKFYIDKHGSLNKDDQIGDSMSNKSKDTNLNDESDEKKVDSKLSSDSSGEISDFEPDLTNNQLSSCKSEDTSTNITDSLKKEETNQNVCVRDDSDDAQVSFFIDTKLNQISEEIKFNFNTNQDYDQISNDNLPSPADDKVFDELDISSEKFNNSSKILGSKEFEVDDDELIKDLKKFSKEELKKNSCDFILKVKGVFLNCSLKDVIETFKGCNLDESSIVMHVVDGRFNGQVFIDFKNNDDMMSAFDCDIRKLRFGDKQPVQLLYASREELDAAIEDVKVVDAELNEFVKLKSIPHDTTKGDVIRFFETLNIDKDGILIVEDRSNQVRECYVQFTSAEDAKKGMLKNGEPLKSRYVEVYKSSKTQFKNMAKYMLKRKTEDPSYSFNKCSLNHQQKPSCHRSKTYPSNANDDKSPNNENANETSRDKRSSLAKHSDSSSTKRSDDSPDHGSNFQDDDDGFSFYFDLNSTDIDRGYERNRHSSPEGSRNSGERNRNTESQSTYKGRSITPNRNTYRRRSPYNRTNDSRRPNKMRTSSSDRKNERSQRYKRKRSRSRSPWRSPKRSSPSNDEFLKSLIVNDVPSSKISTNPLNVSEHLKIVKIKHLPINVSKDQLADFLKDNKLSVEHIVTYNDQRKKGTEAKVQFKTLQDAQNSKKLHGSYFKKNKIDVITHPDIRATRIYRERSSARSPIRSPVRSSYARSSARSPIRSPVRSYPRSPIKSSATSSYARSSARSPIRSPVRSSPRSPRRSFAASSYAKSPINSDELNEKSLIRYPEYLYGRRPLNSNNGDQANGSSKVDSNEKNSDIEKFTAFLSDPSNMKNFEIFSNCLKGLNMLPALNSDPKLSNENLTEIINSVNMQSEKAKSEREEKMQARKNLDPRLRKFKTEKNEF